MIVVIQAKGNLTRPRRGGADEVTLHRTPIQKPREPMQSTDGRVTHLVQVPLSLGTLI